MKMRWKDLLATKRLVGHGNIKFSSKQSFRTEYERDYSRVLYSNAFRRLHDKTQVFPMPDNDHVHSRLTHSLEVADVGRTLGTKVGHIIIRKHNLKNITPADIGYIVSAACLAHDIGNPPFGHSGEDAFSAYFKDRGSQRFIKDIDEILLKDLRAFEGNAQGFRILCRTSDRYENGGLQLTLPTLASFTKYPQTSDCIDKECGDVSRKKFGFCHADSPFYETIASELKLIRRSEMTSWCRHPLAFLTEAADDICYHILDLEDGFILGIIPLEEFYRLLQPIAKVPQIKYSKANRDRERITLLRALALTNLVDSIVECFIHNEEEILDGSFIHALTDVFKYKNQIKNIRNISSNKLYRDEKVVRIEFAGLNVIHTIMSKLLYAVIDKKHKSHAIIKKLFGDTYSYEYFLKSEKYDKILRIVDLVSGMTDGFAVKLFRELSGISLPTI
jgi:dGTPase